MNTPLWTFTYKVGPAPMTGCVEAHDEGTAMLVAQKLCRKNGWRPPAMVRPMILATEAILKEKDPGPESEPLLDAVAATTGVKG